MTFAVHTQGLSRSFGPVRAVESLDLTVESGEMFALVGPDGAGKTTTIRMLCGVLAPTSGAATVLSYDLLTQADALKQHIGYLSQRFTLYGDLTVDENMEFFAEINRVYDYRGRREELLEFTRLSSFRDRLAEKLSGGMKQKLALACTLIHRPRIIFLDEPTTGVDPVSRRDFWSILQALLRQGITIVMSTPYLDEAERCTKVALISNGRLMKMDSPDRLREWMKGEIIEIVCDDVRRAHERLKSHPAIQEAQMFGDRLNVVVDTARRALPEILVVLRSAGVHVAGTRVVAPSLENVYISLLTHTEQTEAGS